MQQSRFILKEEERFARFTDSAGKDLASKLHEFGEDLLTNKKGDPQHNPTINSCLVRISESINSKCGQIVKIVQRWDGKWSAINYLLRDFRRWLICENIDQRRRWNNKMARSQTINSTIIWWIEKILQTPVDDYRKFAVRRILAPYLINIRRLSSDEANDTIRSWLDRCHSLRRLDFNPNFTIIYNINSAKRNGYRPLSLEKLKTENTFLYNVLIKKLDKGLKVW